MRYLVLAVIVFYPLFAAYGEGDQILEDDQIMEFNYCYPTDSLAFIDSSTGDTLKFASTFSLAHNTGKVFLLEMSASW